MEAWKWGSQIESDYLKIHLHLTLYTVNEKIRDFESSYNFYTILLLRRVPLKLLLILYLFFRIFLECYVSYYELVKMIQNVWKQIWNIKV